MRDDVCFITLAYIGEAPIATHIQVVGDRILELGAGAAVPSMIAALRGASYVLITDYPDKELVENIKYNLSENLPVVGDLL